MTDTPLLSVSGLSKTYARQLRRAMLYGLGDFARELNPWRSPARGLRPGEFRALDDVGFDLARGEALAVIGLNGAGKSTLLKAIAGLIKPDAGEIRRPRSVEPLIELGTGLEPLLTGRENIRLRAALAGVHGGAERRLLDEVVAFGGLEAFVDAPLQTYSSGMKARLGFALAVELQPELLLLDEVLAVGDIDFQRRCAMRLLSYRRDGGSILLVSHHPFQVQAMCARAILLHRGRVLFDGDTHPALSRMLDLRQAPARAAEAPGDAPGTVITGLDMRAEGGDRLRTGHPARIELRVRGDRPVTVRWGFTVMTSDLWICVAGEADSRPRRLAAGETRLTVVLPRLPLMPGRFALRAVLLDDETGLVLARRGWEDPPLAFAVGAGGDPAHTMSAASAPLTTVEVTWPDAADQAR